MSFLLNSLYFAIALGELGNNPKTAVWEYLKTHPEFETDKSIQHKLLIKVDPDRYLKRSK